MVRSFQPTGSAARERQKRGPDGTNSRLLTPYYAQHLCSSFASSVRGLALKQSCQLRSALLVGYQVAMTEAIQREVPT